MSNLTKALKNSLNVNVTPQTEVIPGRDADMRENNAGGVSFVVSPWDALDRFLILGTEGGTYYASERKLTKDSAQNALRLIAQDGVRVVNRVVEISDAGRAPKNDPALFVLAMASAADDINTRRAALAALPKVARIGTHLFHYAAFVEQFRGWGRALRNAVGNWYLDQPLDRLANQVIKYQQRDGWSNRDLLRLAHPTTQDPQRDAVFRWAVGGMEGVASTEHKRGLSGNVKVTTRAQVGSILHPQILAFEAAKTGTAQEVIQLIRDHNLPREAIRTDLLTDPAVWEALLERMPMTAMIRNLATMTRSGLLTPMSAAERKVRDALADTDSLRKARVHPIQVLSALLTYKSGKSARGSSTWTPVRGVVDALDAAFYTSFGNVTPTGRNTLLALDVSGSMTGGEIAGVPGLSPRVASAAMALITANVEPSYEIIGFTSGGFTASGNASRWGGGSSVKVLDISPRQRLDSVCNYMNGLGFSGTDCSLPILYAKAQKLPVENFAVYTDNETYAGSIHPSQALADYRKSTGLRAKLAVVGMTATDFTIADPKDAGMMDVVGFDTAAPQIMSDFFSK
jgi:60 kDa SS-A/Ro ribonucleoprotein